MLSKLSSVVNQFVHRSSASASAISISRCWLSSAAHVPLQLNDIDFDSLTIQTTATPKPRSAIQDLKFGKEFTDHMLEIDWDNQHGWHAPTIQPYHNFSVDPASSVFHYALEAFEGMKGYIDSEDRIRLFRPHMNMQRLLSSCEALFFPTFDADEFLDCIHELLRLEKSWIPKAEGYSLYIRPTIISTFPCIGVAPAENVKLYVILSPVGPYYPTGFSAISLLASDEYVRAWRGGCGHKKVGANYGPCIKPQIEAAEKGYTQVMWLHYSEIDQEHYVTEVGTSNQFFFWLNADGEKELITAPLDGTILPGVTRDCVLQLCREWNEFKVTERPFTMAEIVEAHDQQRIIESFGSGTAAIITPVKRIGFKGKDYDIPLDPQNPTEEAGPLASRLFRHILDIQYGTGKVVDTHHWSVVVPEKL